jgi:hypothetical protein
LWLFGQFAATGSGAASYRLTEEPVSQLINDFGRPVASTAAARQRAAMPFVHLERDLWDLRDAAGQEISPDAPERRLATGPRSRRPHPRRHAGQAGPASGRPGPPPSSRPPFPAGTVNSRTVWFSHEAGKREVCDMAGAYSTAGYVAFGISAPGGIAHATAAARKMKRQPQA